MKIKKVIIEGFRAYEKKGEGIFDFSIGEEKSANFVSIYAPNGFGKTSFYDAVEWALTDNIGRFVRDQTRQENDAISRSQSQDGKKPPILRNHAIDSNAQAYVTVVGDDFSITKDVPKASSSKRDYLFKKDSSPRCAAISEIFLSQEAIDAFLREDRPDARYTRFMASFGDSDETYRANLSVIKRDLVVVLRDIRAEEDRLKEILSSPPNVEIFSEVNRTIGLLEKNSEPVFFAGVDFNGDKERELRGVITRRKHELLIATEKLRIAISDLQSVLTRFTEIQTSESIRGTSRRAIQLNLSLKAGFLARENLAARLSQLSSSISQFQLEVTEISDLLLKLPSFQEVFLRIDGLQDDYETASDKLLQLKSTAASFVQRNTDGKKQIELLDISVADLFQLQRDSSLFFEQIESVNAEIKVKVGVQENRLSRKQSLLDKIKISKEKISRISEIDISEKFLVEGNLSALVQEGFSPLPLTAAILEKNKKSSILDQAIDSLKIVHLRSSKISELIAMGVEFISASRSHRCPLCSHEHQSYAALLEQLENNPALLETEANAIRAKEIAQHDADYAANVVAELIDDWKNLKSTTIARVREQVRIDENELDAISTELNIITSDLATLEFSREDLNSKVRGLSSSDLALALASELADFTKRRKAQSEDVDLCTSEVEKLDLSIKSLAQTLEKLSFEIELLKQSSVVLEISKFCAQRGLDLQRVEIELEALLESTVARLEQFRDEAIVSQREIDRIDLQYPSLSTIKVDDIERSIKDLEEKILEADVFLVPIFSLIRNHIPNVNDDEDLVRLKVMLSDALVNATLKMESNVAIENAYELLSAQIIELIPHQKYVQAQAEMDNLKIKKDKHEGLQLSIDLEYVGVIGKLEERINSFFYTDLTNSIYKKIDPHPDFKEIKFVCDFSEGEKPKLHVLVSDSAGGTISPSLYFSAAQVNILSLSIFLARALHEKLDGKPIQCIFIDDPIHSMDSINVLSTIDLLRSISKKFDRQIVLSTHDKNFFDLLKKKVPLREYASKFIELESFGKVKRITHNN